MGKDDHIDDILVNWNYDPNRLNVRMREGIDGRDVLQMRIDMGLLQMEASGRPDGTRPEGSETYLDHLMSLTFHSDSAFTMDEDQCYEVDREFVQYYHRRICWLQLHRYDRAVRDADHTLELMDFCKVHSPDEHWTMSHEQYRPFVLFHRIQAAALSQLDEESPEVAVEEINSGLEQLRELFEDEGVDEVFDENELVQRLVELREELRDKFDVGDKLHERLRVAVENEEYELAAKLRDEIAQRSDVGL